MDCFFKCLNPYIPPGVPEPSLAQINQKKLVGEGIAERKEVGKKVGKMFMDMIGGKETDKEVVEEVYQEVCKDIRKERARVGGDWVVAGVLNTPHTRQVVRSALGPEVEMVVLNMAEADQEARVMARHAGDQTIVDVIKVGLKEKVDDESAPPGDLRRLPAGAARRGAGQRSGGGAGYDARRGRCHGPGRDCLESIGKYLNM